MVRLYQKQMKGNDKMRKILFFAITLCVMASLAHANDYSNDVAHAEGTIIDKANVSSHKWQDLAAFVKTYTKDDALLPQAMASGYSIFIGEKLLPFDSSATPMIIEFLKKADSTLDVIATIKIFASPEGFILVSIKNQPKDAAK